MPVNDIRTRFKLEGEQEYKRAMTDAANAVKTLNAEEKLAKAQFEATGDAEQYAADQARILKEQIQNQEKAVKAAEEAVKKLTDNGLDKNSREMQKWRQKLANSKSELIRLKTRLDNTQKGLVDEANEFGKTESAAVSYQSQLENVNKGIDFQNTIYAIDQVTDHIEAIIRGAAKAAKALWDMGVDAGKWADDIATKANEAGVDPDVYQSWVYASRFIDTSVDDIVKNWRDIDNKLAQSGDSLYEYMGTMAKAGIAVKDAAGNMRSGSDIFWDTIDYLHNITDATTRDSEALRLFGNDWRKLNPLIKAGSQAYKDAADEGMSIAVVSNENVEALGAVDDEMQKLQAQLDKLKYDSLAALAPTFQKVAEALNLAVSALNDFIQSDEGQAALAELNETLSGIIESFLGDDNGQGTFEAIVTGAKKAVEDFTKAMEWIQKNGWIVTGVVGALGLAWSGLKVTKEVLTFAELLGKLGSGNSGGIFGKLFKKGDSITDSLSNASKTFEESASVAKTAADTAKTAADAAKSSADGASSSAGAAKSSAEGAGSSAEGAKSSADASKSSADASKNSADASKNSADGAKSSADASKSSADGAKSSADASKNSADASKSSADASKNSADASKSSADGAKSSADASKNSADASKNSADASKSSADGAKSSADASKSAADASNSSAGASKSSAEAAASSASAAKSSSDAAASSASAVGESVTSAANSALAAAESALGAAEARAALESGVSGALDSAANAAAARIQAENAARDALAAAERAKLTSGSGSNLLESGKNWIQKLLGNGVNVRPTINLPAGGKGAALPAPANPLALPAGSDNNTQIKASVPLGGLAKILGSGAALKLAGGAGIFGWMMRPKSGAPDDLSSLWDANGNPTTAARDSGINYTFTNEEIDVSENLNQINLAKQKAAAEAAAKLNEERKKAAEEYYDALRGNDDDLFFDKMLAFIEAYGDSAKDFDELNDKINELATSAGMLPDDLPAEWFDIGEESTESLAEAVEKNSKGAADAAEIAGENVSVGMANGIDNRASEVYRAAKRLAGGVTNVIRATMLIHSPSKVTEQLGAYTAMGFADGISDGTSAVNAAVSKMLGATTAGPVTAFGGLELPAAASGAAPRAAGSGAKPSTINATIVMDKKVVGEMIAPVVNSTIGAIVSTERV